MYLHIGNNNIVKETDLIAMYNIDSIKDLTSSHSLIKEEGVEAKSLIIAKTEDKIIGYISNISSTTIAKRTEMNMKVK